MNLGDYSVLTNSALVEESFARPQRRGNREIIRKLSIDQASNTQLWFIAHLGLVVRSNDSFPSATKPRNSQTANGAKSTVEGSINVFRLVQVGNPSAKNQAMLAWVNDCSE